MRWHEITIYTTEEATEMIADIVHELGAGGVSIEESGTLNKERDTSLGQWYELPLNNIPEGRAVLKGYFAEETDIQALTEQLNEAIARLVQHDIDTGEPVIETSIVDDEDWANAWKQYFKPLKVSERLTIKPTWEDYEPQENEVVIEIDPGMAFGTGTHATTALCMQALEEVIAGGEHVIDIGTGSGILAITALRLGADHVLALDLDPVAVSSAANNADMNGLEQRVTAMHSDLLQAVQAKEQNVAIGVSLPVKVVVANILAEIIVQFVDDVYDVLETGGYYIASGIITSKEGLVRDALSAAGFEIVRTKHDQDWVVIVARKR